MGLFAWAKGFIDVLLNKQTICLVDKVKKKSSMLAGWCVIVSAHAISHVEFFVGHLNLLISKPVQAFKQIIPHLEKEMDKFIKVSLEYIKMLYCSWNFSEQVQNCFGAAH